MNAIIKTPKVGEWFRVTPKSINRERFNLPRKNPEVDKVCRLICEAFKEMDANPKKYAKDFETYRPEKTWKGGKKVIELYEMSKQHGYHLTTWIEQSLEWAQRIQNGESWHTVCNESDSIDWYRLIAWKNGYPKLVGKKFPANVVKQQVFTFTTLCDTIPSITRYVVD